MEERRHRLRIPLESDVMLRHPHGRRWYSGRVKNISSDGILLATEKGFAPGCVIRLEVVSESGGDPRTTPMSASLRVSRAEGLKPPFAVAGVIPPTALLTFLKLASSLPGITRSGQCPR